MWPTARQGQLVKKCTCYDHLSVCFVKQYTQFPAIDTKIISLQSTVFFRLRIHPFVSIATCFKNKFQTLSETSWILMGFFHHQQNRQRKEMKLTSYVSFFYLTWVLAIFIVIAFDRKREQRKHLILFLCVCSVERLVIKLVCWQVSWLVGRLVGWSVGR